VGRGVALKPTVEKRKGCPRGSIKTLFEKVHQAAAENHNHLHSPCNYHMHGANHGFQFEQFYGNELDHIRVCAMPAWKHDTVNAHPATACGISRHGRPSGFLEITIPESRSTASPEKTDLLLKLAAPQTHYDQE
jgi:hypothetical protein